MTRAVAITCAQHEAAQAPDRRFAVYRFTAWPPDVYGVRDVERLAPEAERFETFGRVYPGGPHAPVSCCKSTETAENAENSARTACLPAPTRQGSLF